MRFSVFEKIAKDKNYLIYTDNRINIVGYRFGDADQWGNDMFADVICLYRFVKGNWQEYTYYASTIPGIPYLRSPINPYGAAILVPGQYVDSYELGFHKSFPALVQAKPVKVFRDNNKDDILDLDLKTIQSGMFGINIHRAGLFTKYIGKSSAGCQVFQYMSDFEEFLTLCKEQVYRYFTYTLVEI